MDSIDPGLIERILDALGGGPLAVFSLALMIAVWRVLNWWREDLKEANAAMREVQKESTDSLSRVSEALRSLSEEVRRRV